MTILSGPLIIGQNAPNRPMSICITTVSYEVDHNHNNMAWQFGWGATANPTANLATYILFVVTETIVARKMFHLNGATAAGNVDVGIYSSNSNHLPTTRLVSIGGVAMSGINAMQVFDIENTTLTPGVYHLAHVLTDTNARVQTQSNAIGSAWRPWGGITQQSSAYPLPSVATPATPTVSRVPFVGLSQRDLIA